MEAIYRFYAIYIPGSNTSSVMDLNYIFKFFTYF